MTNSSEIISGWLQRNQSDIEIIVLMAIAGLVVVMVVIGIKVKEFLDDLFERNRPR